MSDIENKLSFIGSLLNKPPTKDHVEDSLENMQITNNANANDDVSFLVINSVAKVKGDIISTGDVLIDGELEGSISARNLKITKNGRVLGVVNVQTAIIAGSQSPEIYCQERLTIKETGKISGKVVAKELVIFAGGKLLGLVEEPSAANSESRQLSSIFTSKN